MTSGNQCPLSPPVPAVGALLSAGLPWRGSCGLQNQKLPLDQSSLQRVPLLSAVPTRVLGGSADIDVADTLNLLMEIQLGGEDLLFTPSSSLSHSKPGERAQELTEQAFEGDFCSAQHLFTILTLALQPCTRFVGPALLLLMMSYFSPLKVALSPLGKQPLAFVCHQLSRADLPSCMVGKTCLTLHILRPPDTRVLLMSQLSTYQGFIALRQSLSFVNFALTT